MHQKCIFMHNKTNRHIKIKEIITSNNISKQEELLNILQKEGLPLYEIKIWETPTSSVVYRGGEKF